jgi:predicted Zn finger-like uncharacterized protein
VKTAGIRRAAGCGHGFRSINGRLLRSAHDYAADAMLIVCPSCATSYMVDPATLGPAGRTVRCARCKVSWFAGGFVPAPNRTATVDDVTDEAETSSPAKAFGELPPAVADTAPSSPANAEDGVSAASGAPTGEPKDAGGEPELPPSAIPEVVEAPSLVPPTGPEPLPESATGDNGSDDIETYAARRQRLQARRKQKRRSIRWTALALVLFAVNVTVIGARNELVRMLPQTASFFAAIGLPVNLRQLSFENVKISKETQDGVSVLIVQGTIVSTASKPITVPRLRFAARDGAGQEIYTWTALPTRSILGPDERLESRSRLASPPADARNVLVRFFNSQDASGAE